jgi:hypothetical protein
MLELADSLLELGDAQPPARDRQHQLFAELGRDLAATIDDVS